MNNDEQKARWDLKYEDGLPSLTEPDPFFISAYEKFVDPSFKNVGVALDLAGGLGRHALWLATRGWLLTVIDVSEVAIEKLRRSALELNINLELLVMDAADFEFDPVSFDLIVLFYHLDRRLFPKIISAMKPGGILVSKMSLRWDSPGGSKGASEPLGRGELPSLLAQLHVLYHWERPVRDRGVVEFVGRKQGNAS